MVSLVWHCSAWTFAFLKLNVVCELVVHWASAFSLRSNLTEDFFFLFLFRLWWTPAWKVQLDWQ